MWPERPGRRQPRLPRARAPQPPAATARAKKARATQSPADAARATPSNVRTGGSSDSNVSMARTGGYEEYGGVQREAAGGRAPATRARRARRSPRQRTTSCRRRCARCAPSTAPSSATSTSCRFPTGRTARTSSAGAAITSAGGGGVRHGWGRRASASAGLNGRRHASFPGGGRLIGALRFLFPPRWLSQRERAARVLTAEPQVTMHAAGCRRLPSLAVLQKRGWVSAHNQQQPDHICC